MGTADNKMHFNTREHVVIAMGKAAPRTAATALLPQLCLAQSNHITKHL